MPHTNRKKKTLNSQTTLKSNAKKFTHSKREYIEYEDGWTKVADKGMKSILGRINSVSDDFSPTIDMTIEEMAKEHERYREEWESSSACAKLREILLSNEKPGNHTVTNAVCLGLGSLQGFSLEWRRSSHIQLAALLTIKETTKLTSQILLQDPRFTELDRQFLTSKDYGVVEDPEAFSHINETSLVYAIHCPLRLFSKVKQGPSPALIIGNDFRDSRLNMTEIQENELFESARKEKIQHEDSLLDLTESSPNDPKYYRDTLALIANYQEITFPQLRHDFASTKIFWRNSPDPKQQDGSGEVNVR